MAKEEIIISGVHLDLTEALKSMVTEKVARLYRHEGDIIRVRVELSYNQQKKADEFTAKGHIEIEGPDMHASATTEDLYKSIDDLVDKLDRMIRKRSRKELSKRNHPKGVDVGVEIPKVNA